MNMIENSASSETNVKNEYILSKILNKTLEI